MDVPSLHEDPYGALGVRPFINCCGTRSVHGGSLVLPQVKAAMAAASRQFVNIDELMAAARRRIALLTGADDGIVTAGSAAAIAIATAAAMAANDPVRLLRLPGEGTHPRRVVMLKGHRNPYDQAIRMVGARIDEIETESDLASLDPAEIAMIAYLASRDTNASVQLETLVDFGRRNSIPLLVDAASLPLRRPDLWLGRGADLVAYSGGKLLRGPQSSGLLLGRRDLIDTAWANSPPHRAFGRPMKLGKEEIVGALAALESWFARDVAAERQRWHDDCDTIIAALAGTAGASVTILPPDEGEDAPVLQLAWRGSLHGAELRRRLLDHTPRIMLDDASAGPGTIKLEVVNLAPGEAAIVGRAIADALAQEYHAVETDGPAVDLTGDWIFDVSFPRRPRQHLVAILQHGAELNGKQASEAFAGPFTGRVTGSSVLLIFEAAYEGAIISYRFEGRIHAGEMEGEVILGSLSPGTRGEINGSQYGKALWRGRRA